MLTLQHKFSKFIKRRLFTPNNLRRLMNLWPPFLGAGIQITFMSADALEIHLSLKKRWWNLNMNRTQYGGSIFSLTDTAYSVLINYWLGKKYFVCDKHAHIEFIHAGKSDLFTQAKITKSDLKKIIKHTQKGEKHCPVFTLTVIDKDNTKIAQVERTLYVRQKPQFRRRND